MTLSMLVAGLAMAMVGAPVEETPVMCPLMKFAGKQLPGYSMDYNGMRFFVCCKGCIARFEKNPKEGFTRGLSLHEGKAVAISLFNPIDGMRIEAKDAVAYADHQGVRYYFAKADEKKTFEASPEKYAKIAETESLWCPYCQLEDAKYEDAIGYGDYNGVRYYFYCPECGELLQKDPAKYASLVDKKWHRAPGITK